MAITNHERVGKAMDLLKNRLAPFVDREIKTLSDDEARNLVTRFSGENRMVSDKPVLDWDVAALL